MPERVKREREMCTSRLRKNKRVYTHQVIRKRKETEINFLLKKTIVVGLFVDLRMDECLLVMSRSIVATGVSRPQELARAMRMA